MHTLILKNIVNDSSSNKEGVILFNLLKDAYQKNDSVLLSVDSEQVISSSFLNSSIGAFIESYGLESFKSTVKFKGSKNQFQRLSGYIKKYSELYPV